MDRESTEDKGEIGNSNPLQDIRIILLGRKWCGKSQAGNTILGWEGLDNVDETVENKVRHGEVAGRWRVTVVETPGWWKNFYPNETIELAKMGLIQSVSLCAPGPHVFLLIIDMDTVLDKKSGKAVEEHMEVLGDGVWNHTMVLLNYGSWQESYTSVGEYMDKRGKVLHSIVRKCRARFHLLDNKNRDSRTQVIELLEKIERMVAANGGNLFELDANIAQDMKSKMKDVNEKAKQREMSVKIERDAFRETYKGETHHLAEIRMLLLGCVLSGKTLVGDTILGVPVGERKRTHSSVEKQSQVGRWTVRLVDTPGWLRFRSLKDTPEMVKQEIAAGVSLCRPGPHAIILVLCISNAFTEAKLRSIREHMSLLGHDVWRHTLVLFSWCNTIGETTVEQIIESEGKALQWLLRKCNNRYHSFNTERANDPAQVVELLEKIEWMVAGNSVFHLNTREKEEWEEEGAVPESPSSGESFIERFEELCKRREEEFWENIRRILVKPEKASSIADPPFMSLDEEHRSNETKVSIWLRKQLSGEDTSEYVSDDESM
ncbi:GTPase IMAP family member 8-like isoform X1 [Centroberyx affinis]|uniref:GTPase IMAP family member 8-like isoform X1 n=1 Tax=Centroberyx affinis TaxID=166261 RepID=UPI003A5B9BDA